MLLDSRRGWLQQQQKKIRSRIRKVDGFVAGQLCEEHSSETQPLPHSVLILECLSNNGFHLCFSIGVANASTTIPSLWFSTLFVISPLFFSSSLADFRVHEYAQRKGGFSFTGIEPLLLLPSSPAFS